MPAALEILINEFDPEFSVEDRDIIHANQVFKNAMDLLKNYISRISSENGTLYITDPYIFCNQAGNFDLEYSELIIELLLISRSKKIVFLTSKPRNFSTIIYENVYNELYKRGIHSILCESDEFHDRFWVSENNGAFIFGCSINRVAKKTSLITSLIPSDYEEISDIFEANYE